jgi:6-phosphogluconate dehydrogenase
MVGGETAAIERLDAFFTDIAIENGYAHVGRTGSGHFVKMVHNGIEYGMMQAIGEGFDVLKASEFQLDYEQVGKIWSNGSIIEGQLMRNVESAFGKDSELDKIEGIVDASGEGQWTVETALKLGVSTPVIGSALFARYKSKDEKAFAEKVVAAMRNEFGGHAVYEKKV